MVIRVKGDASSTLGRKQWPEKNQALCFSVHSLVEALNTVLRPSLNSGYGLRGAQSADATGAEKMAWLKEEIHAPIPIPMLADSMVQRLKITHPNNSFLQRD